MEEHKQHLDGALFVDESEDFEEPAESGSQGQAGDGKAEQAADLLVEILDLMGLETEVDIREDRERVILNVEGPDAGRAIGKKGSTLDAVQFLINKMVNRSMEGRRHVVVDSGDYRDRRDKGLISMARKQAKRAAQSGRVVTLEPMNARDRRVIHMSLAKFPGVSTHSDGEGNARRIQIIPARNQRRPQYQDRP